MKIRAAFVLSALVLFSIPLHAESEADLRYRLHSQEILLHNRSEEIGRQQQENAELRRQLSTARTQTNIGATLTKQARTAEARHDELVGDATELTDQVKANNDSALERARDLTAVGERAVSAGERSADTSESVRDRQLTQLLLSIITILGGIAGGLKVLLEHKKTTALVAKVETNSNGHVAALIAAKDTALAEFQKMAAIQAAKDAAIIELLQHKVNLLAGATKQPQANRRR